MAFGAMASRAVFELAFTGDTRALQSAFDRAGHSIRGMADQSDQHRRRLGPYITTLRAGVAGALVAVGAFLGDSVHKAEEAEVSQARLARTLRNAGISWRDHREQIEHVITSTANLSGIDDHELKDAFTNIVRVTGDHPGGLKRALDLTSLAADIARAKHIDAATAGQLLGRVAGGNTGILRRYGIQIDKGATSTEALGILHEKFAGQAKAYGETAQGAQDRFRVAVTRLQVEIGTKLLPVLTTLINVTVSVINHIGDVTHAIAGAAQSVVHWFGDLPDRITGAIHAAPGVLLDAGKFVLKSIFDGFMSSPKAVADAAGWLKDQLVDAVKNLFGLGGGGGGGGGQTKAFTGANTHGVGLKSVPGFAGGGDFIVSRPTMINAGATGGTRVTVTPLTRPHRIGASSDVQIIMHEPRFTAPGHATKFARKLAFQIAST